MGFIEELIMEPDSSDLLSFPKGRRNSAMGQKNVQFLSLLHFEDLFDFTGHIRRQEHLL